MFSDIRTYPALDVVVTREGIAHVWADLPGVKPEEINIYVKDMLLVIEGHKQPHYHNIQGKFFILAERVTAHFRRTIRLVASVHLDSLKYTLEDGVLHISWKRDI